MSDPAVEAVVRACGGELAAAFHDYCRGDLEDAAREALAPIREWYEGFYERMPELELLIYSSDELGGE